MRLIRLPLILSALLAMTLACEAGPRGFSGGCSGGSCGGGGFPMAEPIHPYSPDTDPNYDALLGRMPEGLSWVKPQDPADGHRIYLFKNGVQVGGWDYKEKHYRPYHRIGNWWGVPRKTPPIDPPAPPKSFDEWPKSERLQAYQLNGVDRSKLDATEQGYTINGKAATKWSVYDALLDDDSGKLWLIVIGSDDQRKKVADDLGSAPAAAALKSKVRLWSVPPTHFSLRDRESNQPIFDLSGTPSIYLLGADGDLLEKRLGYNGPEDLRKIDPAVKAQEDALAAAAAKKKADDEAAAAKKKKDDEDAAAAAKKKAADDALAAAKKQADDQAVIKKPDTNNSGTPPALHMCCGAAITGTILGTILLVLKGQKS